MSLQTQFNKFNKKITVTWQDPKMKKVKEKNNGENGIEKKIRDKFTEEGYPVQEVFDQGSYAINTSIIHHKDDDYDIDRGIVINTNNAPEDAREVKKVLKKILENRNLKNPKIKKPCVTAQYYESGIEKFHIDYPIYKKDSNDDYWLAIGKETANKADVFWEKVDIRGLIKLLDGKDIDEVKEREQYKRLVKYLKKWRNTVFKDTKRKKIYSVALTVMIKENFKSSITSDGEKNDIEALYKTIEAILKNNYFISSGFNEFDVVVKLPTLPYHDIFRKHGAEIGTLFKQSLEKLKINLEKVINETSLEKQCDLLRDQVFGIEFPEGKDCVNKKDENQQYKNPGFVRSPQGA